MASKKTDSKTDSKDSKKDTDKKNMRSLAAVGGIMLIVVLIMAAGIYFMNRAQNAEPETVRYNNITFVKGEDDAWYVQIFIKDAEYLVPFHYTPQETENVNVESSITEMFDLQADNADKKVYISVEPTESAKVVIASVEIARILGTAYDIYNYNVSSAILTPVEGSGVPVIDCTNSTEDVTVIRIIAGESNRIYSSGRCLTIEGTDAEETIRVADAMAYRLIGVIKE